MTAQEKTFDRQQPFCRYVLGCCLPVLLIMFCSQAPLQAQESAAAKALSPESVPVTIKKRDEIAYDPTKRSLFPETYRKYRNILYEWERKLGLEVSISYDVLTQGYVDDDQSLGGTAGDLTLSGIWLLFGDKYNRPVSLTFRLRNRNAYSASPPSDISTETGLLWRTTDGFNDSGFQIPSLYISQKLQDGNIIMRYGQFSIDEFFDSHRLRGAKNFFLSQAFSSNPTVNFPSFGAGLVGYWKSDENWSITAGASNIQASNAATEQVDLKLNSTALFSSLQGGHDFDGVAGKNARIQAMVWHSDAIDDEGVPAGRGLSVTLEHQGGNAGERYVFRAAASDGGATNTDTMLFAGFGKEVRKYDNVGIGVGAGRSEATAEWEGVLEMYYRWQVTKELLITPDIQFIVGDDVDGDSTVRFVGGLRMGITF